MKTGLNIFDRDRAAGTVQLVRPVWLAERVGVAILLLIGMGPFLLQLVWSIGRSWFWPNLLPAEWSWRAWSYVVSPEAGLRVALANSLVTASMVSILSVIIALPAARALTRRSLSGRNWLLFLILLPLLAPPLAATMGLHLLFVQYGLADTLTGVVLVHLVPSVPYAILVLAANLARFDVELESQARTLGANRFAVWRYVTLPLIKPGLAVAFGFAFLISWSQYLSTLIIGGGRVSTLPLALVAFQQGGDEPITSALSLVFLVPAVIVLTLVGRSMVTDKNVRG